MIYERPWFCTDLKNTRLLAPEAHILLSSAIAGCVNWAACREDAWQYPLKQQEYLPSIQLSLLWAAWAEPGQSRGPVNYGYLTSDLEMQALETRILLLLPTLLGYRESHLQGLPCNCHSEAGVQLSKARNPRWCALVAAMVPAGLWVGGVDYSVAILSMPSQSDLGLEVLGVGCRMEDFSVSVPGGQKPKIQRPLRAVSRTDVPSPLLCSICDSSYSVNLPTTAPHSPVPSNWSLSHLPSFMNDIENSGTH